MSSSYPLISYCIAVYNEQDVVISQLQKIKSELISLLGDNNFEIVIVDNGSKDNTISLLKELNDPHIHPVFLSEKGIGLAFREGIKAAKYEFVVLEGIDFPFGITDLKDALSVQSQYDIIFASKAHQRSKVAAPLSRKISSSIYRTLQKFLFNIPVGDTQASVFMNKQKILPILKYCDANDASFSSQLAIYSQYKGLRIGEIPVTMINENINRKSKFNILKDGKIIFKSLLNEYQKFQRVKQEKHNENNY